MEDYSWNLTSLWDTAEAFGASPGIHRGLVKWWLLAEPGCISNINNITYTEQAEAETQTSDAVKAALLIGGANKRRYGGLKNDLGNNYLMGTDQYPDTTDQSLHKLILKIERICVGFEDHKQEVYNLVQAMKTLFLYNQKET